MYHVRIRVQGASTSLDIEIGADDSPLESRQVEQYDASLRASLRRFLIPWTPNTRHIRSADSVTVCKGGARYKVLEANAHSRRRRVELVCQLYGGT